ncbi:enolase C-terminal domain-like protein [Actinomadura kijaniata]|uniref:enolase C-terminal domain-like protein n=1 Tax=Actinomadura kijaniata TaxID=46161 RepID=UPI003F1AC1C3
MSAAGDPLVRSVRAAAYTVPTDRPEGDGTLEWDATEVVVVRAEAEGEVGLGWAYGGSACAAVVATKLADVVRGLPALDVAGAWQAMVRAMRDDARQGIAGCAISAVDVALWDLKARLLEVPLHRLLGGVRESVPVYGSGGFTTDDDRRLVAQVEEWVGALGIPRVKIRVGEGWGTAVDRDLERMRLVREVAGDEVALYMDANGAYSRKQAVRVARAAWDLDVGWFEEPVSSDDLEGLRVVRDAVDADVTAGEHGYDLAYFQRMCEVVDCLQADASRCGGISEWQRVAAVAAARGLEVSGHCAPHLHAVVGAATPNLRHLEWFHDHVRVESLFFDGVLEPEGGEVRPRGDVVGHGLTFREADVERYRVE